MSRQLSYNYQTHLLEDWITKEDETEVPFSEWILKVEQYADRTRQTRNVTLRRLLRDGALHH